MAGSDFFGTPEGFRTYDKDQAELALLASQTEHQRALTGLNQAQTSAMTRKAAADERLQAALSSLSGGTGNAAGSAPPTLESLVGQLSQAAGVYASVGQFDEASKLVKQLSGVKQDVAAAGAASQLTTNRKAQNDLAKMRLMQEALAPVRSRADYDAARLMLKGNKLTADEELPEVYDPRGVQAFVAGSPAAIAKREADIKAADLARKQADSVVTRALNRARKDATERRVAVTEAREERLAKAGAAGTGEKAVDMPRNSEVEAVRGIFKSLKIKLDDDTASTAAQEFAEQARILWKRNPGLSAGEARTKVVQEALARGELEADTWTDTTYKPKPGSVSRPVDAPQDAKAYREGLYYRAPDGRIAQFKQGRLVLMTPAARVPQAQNPLADDEEDEE